MTETPSPNPYSDIFLRQLINALGYAIDTVRGKTMLDEESRTHALTVANLGLQHPHAWACTRELLLLLAPIMEQAGWREEWIPFLGIGVEQATERGDLEAVGEYHYHLGLLYQLLAEYPKTEKHYCQSAIAFETLSDPERQGRTLNHWAYAALTNAVQVELAINLVEQAEALVMSLEEKGYSCMVRGLKAKRENQPAITHHWFIKSLEYWESSNSPRSIAWGLSNLGLALNDISQYEEASKVLDRALVYFEMIHDPANYAIALHNVGIAYYHLQDPTTALSYYQEAITECRKSNRGRPLAMLYNSVGKSYLALGEWGKAYLSYDLAIEVFRYLQDEAQIANVMSNIVEVMEAEEKLEEAIEFLNNALNRLDQHPLIPSYHFYRQMLVDDLQRIIHKRG